LLQLGWDITFSMAADQDKSAIVFGELHAQIKELIQMLLDFPDLSLGAMSIAGRIHHNTMIFISSF
jgi:hypothetical protein